MICTLVIGQGKKTEQTKIDQNAQQKYKKFLEEDAELISINNYQSIERIENGEYLRKTYNPDKIVLLSIIEYKGLTRGNVTGYLDFYDNGNKLSEGQYKEGLKVGEWKFYNYSDGQLASFGPYEYNKKHGDWKYLNSEGSIVKTCKFDEGKIRGEVHYFNDQSQLVYKEIYKRGKKQEVDIINEEEYSKDAPEASIFPLIYGCEENEKNASKCLRKEVRKLFEQKNGLRAKSMTMEGTGKVYLKFNVNSQGEVDDIKILRGLSNEIDVLTLDVMQRFPKFKQWSTEYDNRLVSFILILDLGDDLMDKNLSSTYMTGLLPYLMDDRVFDMYDKKRKEHYFIPIRIATARF